MPLAHAKSGDAAAIAGYVGKRDELDEAMVEFLLRNLRKNSCDHRI